jgi:molecular chaperone GrpE
MARRKKEHEPDAGQAPSDPPLESETGGTAASGPDMAASGSEATPSQSEAAEPQATQAASSAAAEEQDSANERYLRLRADFENFRARTLREKTELYRRANEDLLAEILPVFDHMELALQAAEQHRNDRDPGPLIEGFGLVRDQLLGVLGKFGLVPVETDGRDFDPNVHEAVSHLASQDVPENRVIAQVRRGYKLGDRLFRAAQVAVSSGAAEPDVCDTSEG